jgi:hypothetical protein
MAKNVILTENNEKTNTLRIKSKQEGVKELKVSLKCYKND